MYPAPPRQSSPLPSELRVSEQMTTTTTTTTTTIGGGCSHVDQAALPAPVGDVPDQAGDETRKDVHGDREEVRRRRLEACAP